MVKHIILWKLKENLTDKDSVKKGIKEGLEGLAGKIPGLQDIHVYTEPLEGSSADVMLDSTFADLESLKGYRTHPAHVAVADTYVRPFTEIRLCINREA